MLNFFFLFKELEEQFLQKKSCPYSQIIKVRLTCSSFEDLLKDDFLWLDDINSDENDRFILV